MKQLHAGVLAAVLAMSVYLSGCSSHVSRVEHYVSPKVQGEEAKINLDEVQKAFWETKGKDNKDFNGWMAAFEKRVNEIYDGKEVVSIDASRETGKLVVTGYIDTVKQEGFKPGDEKLFSIEQTGDAVNDEVPYRVATANGTPYYEGHHSLLGSPIVQYMLLSHLMGGGGWGGRYYTPYSQVHVIHEYRDSFRGTPQYSSQQTNNTGFMSRFKQKSLGGGLESKTSFGSGSSSLSSDAPKRRSFWGGSSSSSASSTSSSSGWGGRRSSGSLFGGGSRGWGGRRR